MVGLALANLGAAFSGSFVVNGSPTKTQMVASAGGSSQLAQLVTGAVVVLVLLALTGPLSYMPQVVLSAVVFLIGVELIDLGAMRRILAVRPVEFAVAAITAAVVVLGRRRAGHPGRDGALPAGPRAPGLPPQERGPRRGQGRAAPQAGRKQGRAAAGPGGLSTHHSMNYANASQLSAEVSALARGERPKPRWFCFDNIRPS